MLLLVGATAFGAEVYRSTDANGIVSYSDRPQDENAQPVFVAVPRAGTPAAPPPRPSRAAGESTAAATPEAAAPAAEEPPAPTAAELAALREENCAIARERRERYDVSRRLYRTLANGEREYLSDAEIDEARARAAADVDTWCD
jgi:hypothetical protein